jgi:hypothetical protein
VSFCSYQKKKKAWLDKTLEACEERMDSDKLLLVLELVDVLGLLALLVQKYKY